MSSHQCYQACYKKEKKRKRRKRRKKGICTDNHIDFLLRCQLLPGIRNRKWLHDQSYYELCKRWVNFPWPLSGGEMGSPSTALVRSHWYGYLPIHRSRSWNWRASKQPSGSIGSRRLCLYLYLLLRMFLGSLCLVSFASSFLGKLSPTSPGEPFTISSGKSITVSSEGTHN